MIAVAIAAAVGVSSGNPEVVKKSLNYLDIGGIMVTVYRVISDRNFICEVKKASPSKGIIAENNNGTA